MREVLPVTTLTPLVTKKIAVRMKSCAPVIPPLLPRDAPILQVAFCKQILTHLSLIYTGV
jgi:hypothetical protein